MKPLNPDEFGEMFSSFRHSAFRFEGLQDYDSPEDAERFAAFLSGKSAAPNQPWCEIVRTATAAGKRMQRVRLVRVPMTDFTRFELACYRWSAEAGEDIRVTDFHPELDGFRDFWLFDMTTAVLMNYDQRGRYLSAELADRVDTDRCIGIRGLLLSHAVPLNDYLAVTGVA
jgi:hypothetical protein